MQVGKTVTGKSFRYSGSLAEGITVYFKPPTKMKVSPEIIRIIRKEITARSPVLMGAISYPLVRDSVGEALVRKYNKKSPGVLSYVVPLLVEEGFCTVADRWPFVIYKKR